MDLFIQQAMAEAGSHLANVIQVLYDGVAFPAGGKVYDVFSHEGDELGQITTADLNFATHFMKRRGRAVGKLMHSDWDPVTKKFSTNYVPAFSFAWEGWHPIDQKHLLKAA
jgi:hypothetical protein